MAAEGVDVSFIQDEDTLRRLWQQTEDFSQKKEIRARMYKLREQRLKEFYTTGEVLSDVRNVTPQIENELPRFESSQIITKSSRYTTSSGETMTHADSIKDQDFMAMKSKEIRDSESPTRDFQTYQETPQSYWKVQSSGGRFQAVGSGGQVEVTSHAHAEKMSGQDNRVVSASGIASGNKSVFDESGQSKVISSYETSVGTGSATKSAGAQNLSVCDSSKEKTSSESQQKSLAVSKPEETQMVAAGGTYSKSSHTSQKQTVVKTRTVIDEDGKRQTYTQSSSSKDSSGGKETAVIDDASKLKDIKPGTYVKEESSRYRLSGKQEKTIDLPGQSVAQIGSSSKEESSTSQRAVEQKAVRESATQLCQKTVEQRAVSESASSQASQKASVLQEAVDIQKAVGSSTSSQVERSAESVARESEQISRSAVSKTEQRSSQHISQSSATQITSQSAAESVDVQKSIAVQSTAQEQVAKVSEARSDSRVSEISEQVARQKISDSVVRDATQRNQEITRVVDDSSSKVTDVAPGKYVKEESGRYAVTAKQEKIIHVIEPRPSDTESVSSRATPTPTPYEQPQRATPIHHPQELQIEKGDVDYTTTYQSHYTPKKISVEVSPSHAHFASSLRAPSLSPERAVSPSKSITDRRYSGARSPTKSISRGSLDRGPGSGSGSGSPSKKFSSPEPRRQSPTKDVGSRRSSTRSTGGYSSTTRSTGGYSRPNNSPTEQTDVTYRSKSTKEKRKFSSHSSRAATKKRSGTPGVSPSASPVPKNEKGRTTSSCSNSSYITENETVQTNVQQNVTDFIAAERSDVSQINTNETVESTHVIQTNDETADRATAIKARDKSPEYSSDGSLVQELYLKTRSEQPINGFTPIKPSPDITSDKKVKASAPSPSSPKKKSVISDSDDTDNVSRRKKSKPPTPVSRKSYSSRSSSVSPYSSPERKFPSIGASPDRERFPSSSPASSPDRKSSPPRKTTTQTRPKKELTEFPSQRRFPEKEKKKPTPIPTPKKPTGRPQTSPKSPTAKKPSTGSVVPPRSPVKKSPPVERKPSDKKIPTTTPVAKKSPITPKSGTRPAVPTQKKPETKKTTMTPKKELTEYPSQRRFPEKEKKRVPSPPPKKSKSPVRSAFVRTDSGKKNQSIISRNSDSKITTTVRKSSKDKIDVKDSNTKTTRAVLRDVNKNRNASANFIRTEVKTEVKQKSKRRNILDYNWEEDKPPTEFLVDDSSSSRENLPTNKRKPTQPRTSSGPILKPKNEKAPKGLPQQRSEPRLNITHTIASKIRAESRKPVQKTETLRRDSKTDVVRRDSKTKVIEKKKSSDSVTGETQLRSRTSKEFLLNEKNAQTKLTATVVKKQVTETRDRVVKNQKLGKKSESSSSESEEDVQKEVSAVVTSKTNREEQHFVQQCRIDGRSHDSKVTTITTTVNTNLLQQPIDEVPRSSRESSVSPDARPVKFIPVSDTEVEELRPRYADRVSEPDDDSDLEYRRRTPQKVIPGPVLEEEDEPKEPTPEVSVKTITQKFIGEQVTDLDEKEIEKEELKIDVSVAERVNQFIETARASATSPLPSRPEDITLKGLDDTINAYLENTEEYNENYESTENVNAVLKAKSMFETIANTQAVSKTASRELQRQDDIISRPSVFDSRRTETTEHQQSELIRHEKRETEEQKIMENDVQVKEEIKKPVGKLNIDEVAPKPVESKKTEVKKQIGKVNVSRFETEIKDGRDTFPRRKATSPVRETGKFDTFPSRKNSRKHSTDSEKSSTRDSSPTDRKKSRGESPGKSRKSPTKELTETPRKPSIPKNEYAPSKTVTERYPFAKQEPQKPPKSPGKSSSPERRSSPTRKDTPIANHISPEKIVPASKNFKPVIEEQETEHPKVNGYLPTDDVILPKVKKPTKIPEDSALKAPALLKKQVLTDERKDEDVQRRSPDKSILKRDSLTGDVQKTEQVKIPKFGVSLRKTNSGGSLGRRSSGDIAKKESEIEQIFDLDLLESMLEKARGYEERRLIRQQIRIVKKMIENGEISYTSQTVTATSRRTSETTTEKKTRSKSKSPPKYSPKEETSPKISHQIVTVNIVSRENNVRRPKSPEKKAVSPDRKSPDKLSNRIESFDGVAVKSQEKIYKKQTIESENKRRSSLDAQGKTIIDVTSNHVKKPAQKQTSKTEIYITPTSTTTKSSSYSVNKTIKKSHIENETKEANLTDSITSSYGVGPTDEKGRPLFGLKALRRQNTGNETETVVITTAQETDSPRDIKDSSGRALFGLKALKISTKSSDNGETMPTLEQPESPQLKEIVARHEKHARGNTVSQTQQQRPSARLRDSFVQSQNETHEEFLRKETEAEEANRIMKDRGQSLRAMIQRHESFTESDKKKPESFNTSSSFSTSTVVRSSAIQKADGTVSLKKEVIEGESISRNGEKPVTKVTKTEYSYQTPEQDREPVSITEIVSDDESKVSTGKSVRRSSKTVTSRSNTSDSVHSRTSSISSSSKSTRKSPSPDRKSQTYVSSTTVRSSSKTIVNDNATKTKDETDAKNSRKMSDKLSQLSKKFSNDSIDSSRKSSISEQRRESSSNTSHYASETKSSINRSSFSKSESQSEISSGQKRSSTTHAEITDAERRRQSSSPESLLRKGQGTTDETEYITSSTFSKVGKGGSVKALSQKFQQVADSPGLKHSASMEVRIGSTRASSITSEQLLNEREIEFKNRNDTNQGFPDEGLNGCTETSERRSFTSESRIGGGQTDSKSFIGNSTKVTGVQDLISRMRAADNDNVPGEALEDSEARSLLNKFLGASVMMSGMEPLVKASKASSATLVSQVERQRILHSTSSKSNLKDSAKSKVKESRKEQEEDIDLIWDERKLKQLLDACTDYEGRRKLRARLRVVMAERSACEEIVAAAREDEESNKSEEGAKSVQQQAHSETTVTSKSTDGEVTKTEVSSKSHSYSVSSSSSSSKVSQAGSTNKPMSPFAKFQQLDRQNSGSSSPSSPRSGNAPLFTFTDPKLSRSASTVKDRLLFWCQMKTKNYKNIQIENFSTSWSNGLAFCALIHHFLPESFDYDSLSPKERRKNFELAFNVAEKEAGICPLLDVDDMVMMKKPDWKCVFTYVQSVYLRFKNED